MTGPTGDAWLVVIDPQRIFADPDSDWSSPMWPDALHRIRALLPHYAGRTILTRWVPPAASERVGSWAAYMAAWPFADRPADDSAFDLVDELADVDANVVDAPTFGKWDVLAPIVGEAATLVVTGVATDCCVISTVLPAADAGATLTVVADACAGSTPENHAAALTVLGLYPPQVQLVMTGDGGALESRP
ncbi:MAG: isochorismatase family protein [Mobilicoccus sp.]|nr:isochorismatase family protein [Mobilicoccus sp.]